jgi:hypothetical protein
LNSRFISFHTLGRAAGSSRLYIDIPGGNLNGKTAKFRRKTAFPRRFWRAWVSGAFIRR